MIQRYFICLTFFCALLLLGALILQYGYGLEPCPLCVMVRFVVIASIGLYFLASLHRPSYKGMAVYSFIGLLFTIVGILITARHLWLLNLPPEQVPDCSPGFDYLMKNFPWNQALVIIFKSSGECAGQHGTLLGVTLPGWTMLGFGILGLANISGLVYSMKKR